VTAVFNTLTIDTEHADFGMPVYGRVRVADLRDLPMTPAAVSAAAVQKCALVQGIVVSGGRFGTDVVTAAFPGTSAWSPPI
jgi:hypothetical protein